MNPNPSRKKIKEMIEKIVDDRKKNEIEQKVTIKNQSHAERLINQEPCSDELINKLYKGDMFGEQSALNDLPHPYTLVVASQKLEYYKI